MTKIHEIAKLGQSIWYDYIQRSLITSGELQKLIDEGLKGMTSNPTIFDKAISNSSDYDADIAELVKQGKSIQEIYEKLALDDIAMAADMLMPVYDATDGRDGFVSLEVNPKLAYDIEGTCAEAKRLFSTLNRPNVLIKVPATEQGLPAITDLLGSGVNVNVTLIFSLENYKKVVEAFIKGLEKLSKNGPTIPGGQPIDKITSVASFFVSRVDTYFDKKLEAIGNKKLQGKIAVANAKVAYAEYQKIFSSDRWKALEAKGAKTQRVLWASTSTKNPNYPVLLYVEELIGPDTINTVPPTTYENIKKLAKVSVTLTRGVEEARKYLAQLVDLGIDYNDVTKKLQEDGVEAFARSFDSLMNSIKEKSKLFDKKSRFELNLGQYKAEVDRAFTKLLEQKIIERIWQADYTVWKPQPDEIANRLGWLESPQSMQNVVPEITTFVNKIREEGFSHALLLGMGGSSLAPEVFRKVFGVQPGYLDLSVLDSTDPEAVLACSEKLDPSKTLYIVSTKSGGTIETLSFAKYFYNQVLNSVGVDRVGSHFIAITDPGSGLEALAKRLNFRRIFLNDPNVGGRFSALTLFGLVPAALLGVDLNWLLQRASAMAEECRKGNSENTAAWLGVALGQMALLGKDKLTFLSSSSIAHFVAWVEQLIAESTGKEGKGILPVDGEMISSIDQYGKDRFFLYLKTAGDVSYDEKIELLKQFGYPLAEIEISDIYNLGREFFRWEFATAVAGWQLGINPFDQPNVELAKIAARQAVATYQEKGQLPKLQPAVEESGIKVFFDGVVSNIRDAFKQFLSQADQGNENGKNRSYIAIHAYLSPREEITAVLQKFRQKLGEKTGFATTLGYGPRFLHSTGQLHKGDGGKGLFIQIVGEPKKDVPIPDEPGSEKSSITFGVLINAQSLGDRLALLDAGRKVLRIQLDEISNGLQKLMEALD